MVRQALVVIALFFALKVPAAAGTVKTSSGVWDIETTTSELDGKVEVAAVVSSKTSSPDIIGQLKPTYLSFICRDGSLNHIVSFPKRVASYRASTALAQWKFDDGDIQKDNWPAINTSAGYMMRNDKAQQFLDASASSGRLVVKIDTNEAVFDLTGSDAVRESVRAQCPSK